MDYTDEDLDMLARRDALLARLDVCMQLRLAAMAQLPPPEPQAKRPPTVRTKARRKPRQQPVETYTPEPAPVIEPVPLPDTSEIPAAPCPEPRPVNRRARRLRGRKPRMTQPDDKRRARRLDNAPASFFIPAITPRALSPPGVEQRYLRPRAFPPWPPPAQRSHSPRWRISCSAVPEFSDLGHSQWPSKRLLHR